MIAFTTGFVLAWSLCTIKITINKTIAAFCQIYFVTSKKSCIPTRMHRKRLSYHSGKHIFLISTIKFSFKVLCMGKSDSGLISLNNRSNSEVKFVGTWYLLIILWANSNLVTESDPRIADESWCSTFHRLVYHIHIPNLQ